MSRSFARVSGGIAIPESCFVSARFRRICSVSAVEAPAIKELESPHFQARIRDVAIVLCPSKKKPEIYSPVEESTRIRCMPSSDSNVVEFLIIVGLCLWWSRNIWVVVPSAEMDVIDMGEFGAECDSASTDTVRFIDALESKRMER